MFSCLVKVFALILLVKGQVIFTILVFLVLLLHWRLSRDHVYDNKNIYNNYYMLLNNLCKLKKSSVVTWPFFVFELIDTSECSSWKTLLKITVQIVIYICLYKRDNVSRFLYIHQDFIYQYITMNIIIIIQWSGGGSWWIFTKLRSGKVNILH